ncbi:MAG TPA: hypothetical protein VN680_00090 [Burkholderiaceae bacterium]|nr:hypothetical protein [Burkholderiaceae bacterium]
MHCTEAINLRDPGRARSGRAAALARAALAGIALAAFVSGCGTSRSPASTSNVDGAAAAAARSGPVSLNSPKAPRSLDELRAQAALRLVAANPGGTYTGKPPELLLAIPVLEVELNANGSVRRIEVMRQPSQAKDTVQLAIAAVHRAAPYGDVSHLPKPWKFTETFLFNEERKFKPMTLDR